MVSSFLTNEPPTAPAPSCFAFAFITPIKKTLSYNACALGRHAWIHLSGLVWSFSVSPSVLVFYESTLYWVGYFWRLLACQLLIFHCMQDATGWVRFWLEDESSEVKLPWNQIATRGSGLGLRCFVLVVKRASFSLSAPQRCVRCLPPRHYITFPSGDVSSWF